MPEKRPYYYRRWFLYSCALTEFDYFLREAVSIVEEEIGRIP